MTISFASPNCKFAKESLPRLRDVFGDDLEEDEDDIDAPFFLESQSYFESKSAVNLNAQLEWYNRIMPKDSQGNPIIPLRMIRGLIDGKGYGKFTKDGKILLSSEMDVEGVVYHEAWHGVTRKLLPTADRYKLYEKIITRSNHVYEWKMMTSCNYNLNMCTGSGILKMILKLSNSHYDFKKYT